MDIEFTDVKEGVTISSGIEINTVTVNGVEATVAENSYYNLFNEDGKKVIIATVTDNAGNVTTYETVLYIDTAIDDFNTAFEDIQASEPITTDAIKAILEAKAIYDNLTATEKEHISGVDYKAATETNREVIGSNEDSKNNLKVLLDLISTANKDQIEDSIAEDIVAKIPVVDAEGGITVEAVDDLEKAYEDIKNDESIKDKINVIGDPTSPELDATTDKIEDLIDSKNAVSILDKNVTNYNQLVEVIKAYDDLSETQKTYAEAMKADKTSTYADENATYDTLKAKIDSFETAVKAINKVTPENYATVKVLIENYDDMCKAEVKTEGLSYTVYEDSFLKLSTIDIIEKWKELVAKITDVETAIKIANDETNLPSIIIDQAKAKYDDLTADEKYLVTGSLEAKVDANEKAKKDDNDFDEEIHDVTISIENLDTTSNKKDIIAVESELEALTSDQQALVNDESKTNLKTYLNYLAPVSEFITTVEEFDLGKEGIDFEFIKAIETDYKGFTDNAENNSQKLGQKHVIDNSVGAKYAEIMDLIARVDDAMDLINKITDSSANEGDCELCTPTTGETVD